MYYPVCTSHIAQARPLRLYVQTLMKFNWNKRKAIANEAKHKVSFELATLVFDDPHMISLPNESEEEERWLTIGSVKGLLILIVVHTWEEQADEEIIRIISARKATEHEKETYENQYKRL